MAKIRVIFSMVIFGTIGAFVSLIDYPSEVIALFRALLGSLVILAYMLIARKKPDFKTVKKSILPLFISGILLGLNWIFLFEAYKFSGVTLGTLCYYMAPVLVILFSPVVLKKKISPLKTLCAFVSVIGMVLVVGFEKTNSIIGIFFGITAAVIYSSIIMINSKLKKVSALDNTFFQLAVSAVVLFPYVLSKYNLSDFSFDAKSIFVLIVLGVVHTGIAYLLYFGALSKLPPQTSAIYSYIDPVVALVLSVMVLSETLTVAKLIGALLILGSAFVSDLNTD